MFEDTFYIRRMLNQFLSANKDFPICPSELLKLELSIYKNQYYIDNMHLYILLSETLTDTFINNLFDPMAEKTKNSRKRHLANVVIDGIYSISMPHLWIKAERDNPNVFSFVI